MTVLWIALRFQGIARGLGIDMVYAVNSYALQGMMPKRTFLLDLPAQEGIKRKRGQHELDRMELQKAEFHEKVAQGYRTLAAMHKERIVIIDAMKPADEIAAIIREELQDLL